MVGRLALILAGLAFALVTAEVSLRVLEPIPEEELLPIPEHPRRSRRLESGAQYVRFDPTLGWVTSPGVRREILGVTYRANRAGLRADREYSPEPSPQTRRIAAFGDSFTYCHEVNLSDCWTTHLEREWSGTEVLNFGVPGYGPDQAWLRYQRDGRGYRPCAVLIGFMVENVNRVVSRYRPFLEPTTDLVASKPRFVLAGNELVLLPNPASDAAQLRDPAWVEREVGPHDRWYFPGVLVPNPLDVFQVVRVARTAAYKYHHGGELPGMLRAYRDQNEAYQVAGRVLIEFAEAVRRDGATPVVVIFTPISEVRAFLEGRGKAHEPMLAWLERAGIPTIDATDAVAEEAGRSGLESVVEWHYQPLGNQVVGKTLAERLPELVGGTCASR